MSDIKELISKVDSLNVLYVEDEKDVRDETSRFFKKFFKNLTIKENGVEAYELLESGEVFDLVITDFKMPKMNGSVVIDKAKELSPKTITVLMSGVSLTIDEKMDVPSDFKLNKPVNFDEFIDFLENSIVPTL